MWLIYVFTTPKEILCGVGVCVGGGNLPSHSISNSSFIII